MLDTTAQQTSLFRSLIKTKRFDEATLRILESLLVSNDLTSVLGVRSSLKAYLRLEYLHVLRDIAGKYVEHKLLILDFFVRAFALIGDVESCFALKYGAFNLRDHMAGSNQHLRVSSMEWLEFSEQLLSNGFSSIAVKACEKALSALSCLEKNDVAEYNTDEYFQTQQAIVKIRRLKDTATKLGASHSVQAQAAVYLTKEIGKGDAPDLYIESYGLSASSQYRNGIKKRHLRKLHECRSDAGYP